MDNRPGWTSPFASLRNRHFLLFFVGLLFALAAVQMQALTLNYLVFRVTNSAKDIGYVNAVTGVTIVIFSFAAGIAADRLSKRNLLITTQLGFGVAAFALGLFINLNVINMGYIYGYSVVYGVLSAVNIVARQSYLPDLVKIDKIVNAQGLVSVNLSLTRIAGPALGGIIIGLSGAATAFFAKSLGQIVFLFFLLMIPLKGQISGPPRSILGDVVDGIRYLKRDRKVSDLLVFGIIPIVLGAPYLYFLPVFQKNVFHTGAAELGLMMSVTGVGAVIGSLFVAALHNSSKKARVQFFTGAGFGAALVLFGIAAGNDSFIMSLVTLGLVGMSGTAFVAINASLVQGITPAGMQGRIQALFTAGIGLISIGALPMGAMVDAVGPSLTMVIFGGATLLFVLIMTLVRPNVRRV